ncbi:MAG: U32 family peptidase [Rikenellaceae bacterium]|nr:U32 family peptidase [Rikenellaceae bacterium]
MQKTYVTHRESSADDVRLELLAPARDFIHGKVAIDAGADAVYVGAPSFGARVAAAVSLDEIERLCHYAHQFGVRVHVAMNTLLYDDELARAERMAHDLWSVGADALIVQDMAFAMMKLPPIEIHASTQTAALSPERVRFLEQAGFSRVILERALSLDEIRAIRAEVKVPLECFVRGAICVCHSGQCYMSHVVSGRSGNRGECSQPCRSMFDLTDGRGNVIERAGHLLSVGDLSLADSLGDLIDAGITSFKIEGRLKDDLYGKNNVAHLSQCLDGQIALRTGYVRSSWGHACAGFTPDPARTFSRPFTHYYLHDTRNKVASFSTGKSTGRAVGVVAEVKGSSFMLGPGSETLVAGDGLCFAAPDGHMVGTRVNRVEGRRVYVRTAEGITPGVTIFRNHDKAFVDTLKAASVRRVIESIFYASFTDGMLNLRGEAAGVSVTITHDVGACPKADNGQRALQMFVLQMRKCGQSVFNVSDVVVTGTVPFMTAAAINALRRTLVDALAAEIVSSYRPPVGQPLKVVPVQGGVADYHYNVVNRLSRLYYHKCGFERVDDGVELLSDFVGIEVMRTRYCIRREMGTCLKEGGRGAELRLENNGNIFMLRFDCARCMMSIIYGGKVRRKNSHRL